ncbi:MAG: septal ring lytic transglycosylase RlpA family protein [Acidobacteria bacterium]|nr:septal ring lytic transglycosylase RlpA family protein [Acidobacteriota bacterium]
MEERDSGTRGWSIAGVLALLVAGLLFIVWPQSGSEVNGNHEGPTRTQVGLASFYGPGFHGERTASGERFDQGKMTAAHRTLPLGTRVRVTNLENGQSVILLINDRGPAGRNYRKGTIIDVSKGAAHRLEFISDGLTRVRLEVLPDEESEQPGRPGVD